METPNQRLKKLRESLGLTQAQFGEKIGLKWSQIKDREIGKVKINTGIANILFYKLGINIEWLLHGRGDMLLKPPFPEAIPITRIPVLGRVPAGFPEDYEEEVIEYISPPHADAGTYGLIVTGESMTPHLMDGDYVLFIADECCKNGDIVVVNNEWGESMVKRYRIKPDGEVWLVSENQNYPAFKPNENWRIIGKVVDVWRRIKI